jgi:putative endonuclease
MKEIYYVYVLTNNKNGTLYTCFTNDLTRRMVEHKCGLYKGFTKKYGIDKLVYYESTNYVLNAIEREKQIKGWLRKKKIELIESINSNWDDLSMDFLDSNSLKEIEENLKARNDMSVDVGIIESSE